MPSTLWFTGSEKGPCRGRRETAGYEIANPAVFVTLFKVPEIVAVVFEAFVVVFTLNVAVV